MEVFLFALLLLVQLSPILVHGNGEADYECKEALNEDKSVESANAKLTKGCVLNGKGITFDIGAMYKAAARKTPQTTAVVIDITDADFTDSTIKLINAEGIPSDINTQVPLLFTMSNSNMKGTSKLEFGEKGENGKKLKIFKLPPKSALRIIDSRLTISSNAQYTDVITFHSLQLVTGSSIEISRNVITMDCKVCIEVSIFFISKYSKMEISDKSSFTLQGNTITMNGDYELNKLKDSYQSVLYGSDGSLTISDSEYTWKSNIISMVGHNAANNMYQSVWFDKFALTISGTSSYTWASNNIKMQAYDVERDLKQVLWNNERNAPITISERSNYKWASNTISMKGYNMKQEHDHWQCVWMMDKSVKILQISVYTWTSNSISMIAHEVSGRLYQYVWHSGINAPLTISASIFTWLSNTINMEAYNVKEKETSFYQSVWNSKFNAGITISDKGTYIWEFNKISMEGHDLTRIEQYVSRLISPLAISGNSHYIWASNDISMTLRNVVKVMYQTVWLTHDLITITSGQFLIETNTILMLAKDYVTIESYVMMLKDSGTVPKGTISGGSSMVWKGNCVGMGHKKSLEYLQPLIDDGIIDSTSDLQDEGIISMSDVLDKRHVFAGKWSITDAGSQLLLDGNYITTTDKYGASSDVTALVLDPTKDTAFTIASGGKLTIGQTQVYSNSDTDSVTAQRLWRSTSLTYNNNVANPAMEWTSSAAKVKRGSPIPTLDISNLKDYMCVPLTVIPSTDPATPEPAAESRTTLPDPLPLEVSHNGKTPVEGSLESDGESHEVRRHSDASSHSEGHLKNEQPLLPVNPDVTPHHDSTPELPAQVGTQENSVKDPKEEERVEDNGGKQTTSGGLPLADAHTDATSPEPVNNADGPPPAEAPAVEPLVIPVPSGDSPEVIPQQKPTHAGGHLFPEEKNPHVNTGGSHSSTSVSSHVPAGSDKEKPNEKQNQELPAQKQNQPKELPAKEEPKVQDGGGTATQAGRDTDTQVKDSGDNVKKEVQKASAPEKDKPKGTETNKKPGTTTHREDTDKKTVGSGGGTSPEAKPGVPKADASPKTSTDKDSKPDTVAKGPPKVSVTVPPMPVVNKTTILSATAISSTIPAVLITSVVFLYLYK